MIDKIRGIEALNNSMGSRRVNGGYDTAFGRDSISLSSAALRKSREGYVSEVSESEEARSLRIEKIKELVEKGEYLSGERIEKAAESWLREMKVLG